MDPNWTNEPLDELAPNDRAAEQSALDQRALAGIRILLVEDDRSARQLLNDILAVAGAEVVAVASVREALATLDHQRIDVLISNIILPDGDGRMLIRQIRTLSVDQGGQIPAIAVTAAANERNRTDLLAAGFQAYFFKPFDIECLIANVASLARLRRDE